MKLDRSPRRALPTPTPTPRPTRAGGRETLGHIISRVVI